MTGAAYDFNRATTSLTRKLLSSPKKVTLVRHGLSSWNQESRIQVSCFLLPKPLFFNLAGLQGKAFQNHCSYSHVILFFHYF